MKNIGVLFKQSAYAAKNFVVKNRSGIMLIAGVTGFVGASVYSSLATLKVAGVLEDRKKYVTSIEELKHDPEMADVYSEVDGRNDTLKINAITGVRLLSLYAPAIALTTLSIISVAISHKMMKDELAALAMAYTALTERFQRYRLNVIDKYGKDADKDIYANSGNNSTISGSELQKRVASEDVNVHRIDVLFDENNSIYCRNDSYYNYTFLLSHQEYLNHQLRLKKVIFLNDVYRELGLSPTFEGQFIGWHDSPENSNSIDFGIFNGEKESEEFCSQRECNVWLHFNTDGYVADKLSKEPHVIGTKK